MEAYGLFVSDVCVRSNLAYNYGPAHFDLHSLRAVLIKEIIPVSTPKGIFLELIKPDGQPERQLLPV